MQNEIPSVILKKGEERRIEKGEAWIYDNEISSNYKKLGKGQIVDILTFDKLFVARGYINPASTITFRALTREPETVIDRAFLLERIKQADQQRLLIDPDSLYYRMVYGEADFLPGLVIDRFDDYFIVQITTAGIENFKEDIFSIIGELYPHAVIVEKSIGTSREKEALETINRVVTEGASSAKLVQINALTFTVDFLKGQKTGFFLDQKRNYLLLKNIARGREVLDAFSYTGAWGLHAYRFGAKSVQFLEISTEAIELTKQNIRLNEFNPDHFSFVREDAIKMLKQMSKENQKKDLIILDPPAFVKSRRNVKAAMKGYKEINLRALTMLNPRSFLITCSCSHFLEKDEFIDVVWRAASDAGRRIKLLEFKAQPYDHAVLLPLFQSEYLKCALFYVY
ncbi:MAG: class I SAM-dependent rRNA methyltransferase [Candidatus Omnitrophota bacterium]